MKKCELCKKGARLYCGSDRASLCWDCDSRVHGANFIVSKHARTLLCRACQSPTPWTAAGPTLRPALAFCTGCAHPPTTCHDAGENQVVPLPSSSSRFPARSSSGSSQEGSCGRPAECLRVDDENNAVEDKDSHYDIGSSEWQ